MGFQQDPSGDWVAELSCLHSQHLRHNPPFQLRPWVLSDEERAAHRGSNIDCTLCARAELPDGLTVVRTAGPFDAASLPAGLRRDHVVAGGTWGRLQVLEGDVTLTLHLEPPLSFRLHEGEGQAIPPGIPHHLNLDAPVSLTIEFLTAGSPNPR